MELDKMRERVSGNVCPFIHKSICEVRHWFWMRGNSVFVQPKGVWWGLGQGRFFHTELTQPCLYGTSFADLCIVMLEQKRALSKLFPQSWKHKIVQKVLLCWSIKSSFHLLLKKNPIAMPFLHQTSQLAQCSQAGKIWRTCLSCSRVQSRHALHHSSWRMVMWGLHAAAWPWKLMP